MLSGSAFQSERKIHLFITFAEFEGLRQLYSFFFRSSGSVINQCISWLLLVIFSKESKENSENVHKQILHFIISIYNFIIVTKFLDIPLGSDKYQEYKIVDINNLSLFRNSQAHFVLPIVKSYMLPFQGCVALQIIKLIQKSHEQKRLKESGLMTQTKKMKARCLFHSCIS